MKVGNHSKVGSKVRFQPRMSEEKQLWGESTAFYIFSVDVISWGWVGPETTEKSKRVETYQWFCCLQKTKTLELGLNEGAKIGKQNSGASDDFWTI